MKELIDLLDEMSPVRTIVDVKINLKPLSVEAVANYDRGILKKLSDGSGVPLSEIESKVTSHIDLLKKNLVELTKYLKELHQKDYENFMKKKSMIPVDKNTIKEVKRHAKSGEYIKIKAVFSPDPFVVGDIILVNSSCDGYVGSYVHEGKQYKLDISPGEYVVLENYKEV